ncbi:hypothetical protein H072_1373 [Dactylellina haptotyla CBS 200.50]|uniref:Uncharacterized protein n=1 Tax=Dactylellina haptotyla (strain CBS 200.50) TaxID=1284197 RepID=S8AP46_DACHA|nr:hypothetical protein H072_1373 [Dactylellina haptotyla CBS 200.50]
MSSSIPPTAEENTIEELEYGAVDILEELEELKREEARRNAELASSAAALPNPLSSTLTGPAPSTLPDPAPPTLPDPAPPTATTTPNQGAQLHKYATRKNTAVSREERASSGYQRLHGG